MRPVHVHRARSAQGTAFQCLMQRLPLSPSKLSSIGSRCTAACGHTPRYPCCCRHHLCCSCSCAGALPGCCSLLLVPLLLARCCICAIICCCCCAVACRALLGGGSWGFGSSWGLVGCCCSACCLLGCHTLRADSDGRRLRLGWGRWHARQRVQQLRYGGCEVQGQAGQASGNGMQHLRAQDTGTAPPCTSRHTLQLKGRPWRHPPTRLIIMGVKLHTAKELSQGHILVMPLPCCHHPHKHSPHP